MYQHHQPSMFHTPIDPKTIRYSNHKIDYNARVLLVGSCFVEHIGAKLDYYKFHNLINPYGILFHPLAILRLFQDVKNQSVYTSDDLVYHNELWHSVNHHSVMSHPDKSVVLDRINRQIKATHAFLQQASHVVLTLGTAWVYHFTERETLVANCHKIPAERFDKYLLSFEEIKTGLEEILEIIRDINPQARIIFTLSPVRHLKDGMIDNMHSKARLLTAIHQMVNHPNTYYFPAYEIMMDDLRDYRFYTDDMLHPNTLAVNYVWDIFKKVWLSPDSEFLQQLEQRKVELKINYGIEF